jgi:hypothetical protein
MNKKRRFVPDIETERAAVKGVSPGISIFENWKDFIYQNGFVWGVLGIMTLYENHFYDGDNALRWIYTPVAIIFTLASLIGKFQSIDTCETTDIDI